MSMFDELLGQVSGNLDIANLAEKVGIDPAQAEAAIKALAGAHSAPGDTVAGAAAQTGLSHDVLNQVLGHLGGEGALGRFAGMLGGADTGGLLGGLAGGLFGKN